MSNCQRKTVGDKGGENVGLLLKAMYGLRDAPKIWQRLVGKILGNLGFDAVVTSQCVYVNRRTCILIVAHVDDFLCLGKKSLLHQLLVDLKKPFVCSGKFLGLDRGEHRELKFLGRTIRIGTRGIEWQGDSKHVGAFLSKVGLERGRPVDTPGVKHEDDQHGEDMTEMSKEEAKVYRGLAALANFMSQDRPDLSFASKELSKSMAGPRKKDMTGAKRLGRYLHKFPIAVIVYPWQDPPTSFKGYSDADWAGDTETRKSTTGGVLLHGSHLIAHWSRTQQTLALSSAESELNAICKAASEGLSAKYLSAELGIPIDLELATDASASRGIIKRVGAGKIKHLTVRQLWVQEREQCGDLKLTKVARDLNWSDMLTHHWSQAVGQVMLQAMGVKRRSHSPLRSVIGFDVSARGGVRIYPSCEPCVAYVSPCVCSFVCF